MKIVVSLLWVSFIFFCFILKCLGVWFLKRKGLLNAKFVIDKFGITKAFLFDLACIFIFFLLGFFVLFSVNHLALQSGFSLESRKQIRIVLYTFLGFQLLFFFHDFKNEIHSAVYEKLRVKFGKFKGFLFLILIYCLAGVVLALISLVCWFAQKN